MALAPIGELFHLKKRPKTVLEVNTALDHPVETVADYVFTDNLRDQFDAIFNRVEMQKGQGYWIRAQYGGGKTHLLAVLAALLSGGEDVWAAAADDDIQQWRKRLTGTRLFPVVFSLRGQASVEQDRPLSLYNVFEQEITAAALARGMKEFCLSTADQILHWWKNADTGIKDQIDRKIREKTGTQASVLLDKRDAFKDAVLDATSDLGVDIRLDVKTEDRLTAAYRQIVNPHTGYTGILVIIDEFAFWQGQRPENTAQAYQDEEFLETIGAKLPQASDLQYTVIVASQQPPPKKLQDANRYREFLVAPGDAAAELWEYQQVVSRRVRDLIPDRGPEIDEYYHDAIDRYSLAGDVTRERFNVMFPVEPTTYRILQRITASLTSERVGINVVWEMLGEQTSDGPRVRPDVQNRRRLVTTPSLLQSLSLKLALKDVDRKDRLDYLDAAHDGLPHCDIDGDEVTLARDIVDTLFLWNIAYPNTNTPMPLDDLTAAILAEQGIYNRPREAVESVLDVVQGLEQIAFDPLAGTAEFVARATGGKAPLQIFNEFKGRPITNIDEQWRKYLLYANVTQYTLAALFAGKASGQGEKVTVEWDRVEYDGRQLLTDYWKGELGAPLARDDNFFRVVYLINPNAQLGSDAIQHDRVAICVPRELTDAERDALRNVVALEQMEQEYGSRSDDEALRVKEYVRQYRPDYMAELMRQQRECYKHGTIVTRASLSIDPQVVFQQPKPDDRTSAIVRPLLENAFHDRPFGQFKGTAPFNGAAAQNLFNALFRNDTTGKARDAASNYAPGLGLSDAATPTRFTGDNAPALALLREWMGEDKDNQGLAVYEIYDRFAARGVPGRMATLFLLAFVRRVPEHAELTIRAGAKLTLEERHESPVSLTSSDVPTIASFPQVADGSPFERLVPSRQVPFGETVDWLKTIDPTLKPTHSPDEISSQGQRIVALAHQLAEGAPGVANAIKDLGQAIHSNVSTDLLDALDTVANFGAATSFADIYALACDRYASQEAFDRAIASVRAADRLAVDAGTIRAAHDYLTTLSDRLDDQPDLETQREAILHQLTLDTLLQPATWPAIQHQIADFKQRYATQYRKFHRDYMSDIASLRTIHAQLGRNLVALERLQSVPELGGGNITLLRNRWQGLAGAIKVCTLQPDAVSVEVHPFCVECRTPFNTMSPRGDVENLECQVKDELDSRVRSFKGAAIQRAIADAKGHGDTVAATLAQAITLGGDQVVLFIADNEASVGLMRALFSKATAHNVKVAASLRKQYATVSTDNIDAVVSYFRQVLEQALREAGEEGEVELV